MSIEYFNDPEIKKRMHVIKKANARRRALAFQKSITPPAKSEFIRDFHGIKAYVLDSSTWSTYHYNRDGGMAMLWYHMVIRGLKNGMMMFALMYMAA